MGTESLLNWGLTVAGISYIVLRIMVAVIVLVLLWLPLIIVAAISTVMQEQVTKMLAWLLYGGDQP